MSTEDNAAKQLSDSDQPSEQQQQQVSPGKQDENQQQASPTMPGANNSTAGQQQKQYANNYNSGNDRQLTARERARMEEIAAELAELNGDALPNARRLLELEIHRLRWGVTEMVDLLNNRRCKIRSKVLIPQDQFPGFNFVGKLLGQGGASLRKLQEESNVKMSILGAGSMRNDRKEQECLETGEAKYQHLKQTLHLQIDCLADPPEAYYRIGHALAKVKEAMTPDPNELANFYNNPMAPHPHMPPHHYGPGGYGPAHHHPHHMPPPPLPPQPQPPMSHPPPPHHHPHAYTTGPPPQHHQQQVPPPPPLPPQQQQQQGGRNNRLSGRVGGGLAGYNPPIGAQQPSGQMRGGGRGGRNNGGMRSSTGGSAN
uniref:KH_dom_type_1 domain-containing protein n=1 Tax=Macrostomum lignano TaxID=282301 RepID=A0A1I8I5G2_9PLAT